MPTHSMWIDGNLVWYNTARARWLDAIGPDVVKVIDHFTSFDAGDWTITETGAAGTEALTDGVGGLLLLTTDALDNDSIEVQHPPEAFLLSASKECYFGIRFKADKATQSDILVGLCVTDTTLIDGMTAGVYFRKDDGDANIDCVTESGSSETETDSGADLVADTFITLEWYYNGSVVTFLVNGVVKATHSTNIPTTAEICPSFAYQNGEANATTMTIDWIRAIQITA